MARGENCAPTKTTTSIELLEARIAPAVVIAANGLSANFDDIDGDRVTITVSKGKLDATDFTTIGLGLGDMLRRIDFSDDGAEFDGANLAGSAMAL